MLTHVIDFLMDDPILSLHGLLDDLGLLHLHQVYDLFSGSLLGLALRQSSHPVRSQLAVEDRIFDDLLHHLVCVSTC